MTHLQHSLLIEPTFDTASQAQALALVDVEIEGILASLKQFAVWLGSLTHLICVEATLFLSAENNTMSEIQDLLDRLDVQREGILEWLIQNAIEYPILSTCQSLDVGIVVEVQAPNAVGTQSYQIHMNPSFAIIMIILHVAPMVDDIPSTTVDVIESMCYYADGCWDRLWLLGNLCSGLYCLPLLQGSLNIAYYHTTYKQEELAGIILMDGAPAGLNLLGHGRKGIINVRLTRAMSNIPPHQHSTNLTPQGFDACYCDAFRWLVTKDQMYTMDISPFL
ncbi:hypothetical protein P691DRAFT_784922, partial [Macrolepiota fuliginosa MF-IS2]